jgi:electron transport complex protein RnfB
MLESFIQIAFLVSLVAAITLALLWARTRFREQPDAVVDALDALLPQTQCAQCGFPGCRPYAQALADGAPLDLCPPGGEDTQRALASLLGRDPGRTLPHQEFCVAVIDESSCVGCFLCVEACPVDAIVGAHRFMHTVLEARCTGCELCLPPCPVDCIELVPIATLEPEPMPVNTVECIRCNRCESVCPEQLAPQHLWWLCRDGELTGAQNIGLADCIECGLCNPVCPSNIDLVGSFRVARQQLGLLTQAEQHASKARQQVDERQQRLNDELLIASDRRSQRLSASRSRREQSES